MRILVVDDEPINLLAAQQTLVGHELVLVDGYDKATVLLEPAAYEEEITKLQGGEGHRISYRQVQEMLRKSTKVFDAVLTDLLMPPGKRGQSPRSRETFQNLPFPSGVMLALHAIRQGAKYVAVFTSGINHHHNPAVWMMEPLRWGWNATPQKFLVNGAILGFFDECDGGRVPVDGTVCQECNGKGCLTYCHETGKLFAKNWGRVLEELIKHHNS